MQLMQIIMPFAVFMLGLIVGFIAGKIVANQEHGGA